MVDLIPFLTKLFSGETSENPYTLTQANQPNDIAGRPISDKAILPGRVPPVSQGLQDAWYTYLMQNVGMPSAPYPGQVNADPSSTRLPEVWKSWQPWDGGMDYIAKQLNGGLGIGVEDPTLAQAKKWGGTGGIGNQYMNLMAQFGTPSEAGRGVANLSQFGVSSHESGDPLIALANGQMSGPAAFLAPFLMNGAGGGSPYSVPNIPQRLTPIAR